MKNQMHNKILEAVNKGIKLAIDNFDDLDNNSNLPNNDIIMDDEYLSKRARYDQLARKVITASKDKLTCLQFNIIELASLAQELGRKFKVPNDRDYLHNLLKVIIYDNGDFEANLNWLDVSEVTDMNNLFRDAYFNEFNGDISRWNVSNVKTMFQMFMWTSFNGDISNWNVSNVVNMRSMFENSSFNGDISKWDIQNVRDMTYMFKNSKFNQDISKWDLTLLKIDVENGIYSQSFKEYLRIMFKNSPLEKKFEYWPKY